jgi:hypothetical protein
LSRELKGTRAWTVSVFVDKNDATRELYGKAATEKGYDWWLELFEKFGRTPLPMAEILSWQENAVLRLRDSSGTCSERVLSGENFLRSHEAGIEFEILRTSYHPLPPHERPSRGDEAMVTIYVRASSYPRTDQARQYSLLMRKRFQQKQILVLFRTDSFFLAQTAFPIIYRFDSTAKPPSREQYEQSKTMYCFCDDPDVRCR